MKLVCGQQHSAVLVYWKTTVNRISMSIFAGHL